MVQTDLLEHHFDNTGFSMRETRVFVYCLPVCREPLDDFIGQRVVHDVPSRPVLTAYLETFVPSRYQYVNTTPCYMFNTCALNCLNWYIQFTELAATQSIHYVLAKASN
jgi:hypothetical protein